MDVLLLWSLTFQLKPLIPSFCLILTFILHVNAWNEPRFYFSPHLSPNHSIIFTNIAFMHTTINVYLKLDWQKHVQKQVFLYLLWSVLSDDDHFCTYLILGHMMSCRNMCGRFVQIFRNTQASHFKTARSSSHFITNRCLIKNKNTQMFCSWVKQKMVLRQEASV